MTELDGLYLHLLHHGLVFIRAAARADDLERCLEEAEYLHEFPTLIGETNVQPSTYPGGSARCRSSDGTAARHHGSGSGRVKTSVPSTMATPDSGSVSASASKTAYDVADQAVTLSWGSAR